MQNYASFPSNRIRFVIADQNLLLRKEFLEAKPCVSKPDKTHTPIMRQAHYQTWWLPRSRRCESWKEEYASTAAILTSDYQRSLHPCNRAHCYQSKSITDIPGEWTHPLHYSQPKIYKENYYLHCSIHEADSSTKKLLELERCIMNTNTRIIMSIWIHKSSVNIQSSSRIT